MNRINTNYDEMYRGQFHFSLRSGWMNDINGLWHNDGLYYMAYQTTPDSTAFSMEKCCMGLATSPDLVHWKEQGVILRPSKLGIPGSGSTVVDLKNCSGLQRANHPVFVTLYSGHTSGVCLAYSNDRGESWQTYPGNPLIPSPTFDPRDPHVFWHTATGKWVMAIYGPDNGNTSFYTSEDLKTWTFASKLTGFGYECPDIYELPVDGDLKNTKWVLMKATGKYLIGTFDGVEFKPEHAEPYDSVFGSHFYAAQSFYRGTFPDRRVVQIAWMGNWGAPFNTAPWNQCATFPAELGLRTFPEGVRLIRQPIAEISKLYEWSKNWKAQTIAAGQNLLSGIQAQCYDLSLEIDLSRSAANAIEFWLPGRWVTYDVRNRTLMGKKLDSSGDRLKLRLLVDWSQLEVFGNEGEYYWSERVALPPGGGSELKLNVDGNTELVSMSLHRISSIWRAFCKTPKLA